MNHAEQQIRKLAIELYEEALATGQHFNLDDLIHRLIADLTARWTTDDHSVLGELVEISARKAVEYVDEQRTRPAEQPTLSEDLDRPIKVGAGQRRLRRRMDGADWAQHMAHVNDNAARVNNAAGRENRRYAALVPYLARGLDTEQALRAWQADHPDEVLP